MKNKTTLAVLLGCVLAATAVAGGIAWNRSQSGQEDETDNYISLEETTGEYLWNIPTHGEEEPAPETTIDTEEETQKQNPTVLQVPETSADKPERPSEGAKDEKPVKNEPEPTEDAGGVPVAMEQALALNFSDSATLSWPVAGEVIKEFSMDHTVYFPTLKQYKVSRSILLSCEAGTTVQAAAAGLVTAVGTDEEIGQYVTMDLGNGYALTYGQLADVAVVPNQYVTAGAPVGILSTPTIYYVVEGDNLYFEMTKDGTPIDPLDYLN